MACLDWVAMSKMHLSAWHSFDHSFVCFFRVCLASYSQVLPGSAKTCFRRQRQVSHIIFPPYFKTSRVPAAAFSSLRKPPNHLKVLLAAAGRLRGPRRRRKKSIAILLVFIGIEKKSCCCSSSSRGRRLPRLKPQTQGPTCDD